MAQIISLGCSVLDVRQRFAAIQKAMFGVSLRRFIDAVTGREPLACASCVGHLADLEQELLALQADISAIEPVEMAQRHREDLQAALQGYVRVLLDAIQRLEGISQGLSEGGDAYRQVDDSGHSPLQRAKIEYDYAIRELETQGAYLSELFSSY